VLPGNADVLQPDFALMPSPDFDSVLVFRTDNMQAPLFLTLPPFVDAFKDDVGQFGLVNRDHLKVEVVAGPGDHAGEGLLADLAFEFGEVVGNHHPSDLFLDFAVDPHLQALHVNTFTGALAFAGGDQEVLRRIVIAKAELTGAYDDLIGIVDSIEFA
jgi:hypothetical protein